MRLQGRTNNCVDGRGGGKEGGRIWGGGFGLIMEQRRLSADMGGQGMDGMERRYEENRGKFSTLTSDSAG